MRCAALAQRIRPNTLRHIHLHAVMACGVLGLEGGLARTTGRSNTAPKAMNNSGSRANERSTPHRWRSLCAPMTKAANAWSGERWGHRKPDSRRTGGAGGGVLACQIDLLSRALMAPHGGAFKAAGGTMAQKKLLPIHQGRQ